MVRKPTGVVALCKGISSFHMRLHFLHLYLCILSLLYIRDRWFRVAKIDAIAHTFGKLVGAVSTPFTLN
jgi:hypothetical protein